LLWIFVRYFGGAPAPALATVTSVEVTFTKVDGRRYRTTVRRDHGPALASRFGPGYHDYLPHDAVHFLVEAEARLPGGVFGRLAQGHSNLFWPADPAQQRRQRRREAKRRITLEQQADMQRSEALASACQVLWEVRTGLRTDLPAWASERASQAAPTALLERILTRLDNFALAWHALGVDDSISLAWPVPVPSLHGRPDAARSRARVIRPPTRQ
jgi:hypothetical protein